MKLSQLVKEIHGAELTNDVQVYGLCADSRVAGEGDLFFCFRGTNTDAHIYAREAAERGAAAIICEKRSPFRRLLSPTDGRQWHEFPPPFMSIPNAFSR